MKVLDLRCSNGHTFEGWFGSEDDFLAQNAGGRIECPLCADAVIVKAPTAPRLNLGARSPVESTPVAAAEPEASLPRALETAWLRAVRHVLATTEDVGHRFADEARKIHHGEVDARGIRGRATPQEREALRDEGIEFASLPVPDFLDGPVQ